MSQITSKRRPSRSLSSEVKSPFAESAEPQAVRETDLEAIVGGLTITELPAAIRAEFSRTRTCGGVIESF